TDHAVRVRGQLRKKEGAFVQVLAGGDLVQVGPWTGNRLGSSSKRVVKGNFFVEIRQAGRSRGCRGYASDDVVRKATGNRNIPFRRKAPIRNFDVFPTSVPSIPHRLKHGCHVPRSELQAGVVLAEKVELMRPVMRQERVQ